MASLLIDVFGLLALTLIVVIVLLPFYCIGSLSPTNTFGIKGWSEAEMIDAYRQGGYAVKFDGVVKRHHSETIAVGAKRYRFKDGEFETFVYFKSGKLVMISGTRFE